MSSNLEEVVKRVAADWAQHTYYDEAETHDFIESFWGEGTVFRQMFAQLDLTSVVELACGHGRHAARVIGDAGATLLLDVNISNIEYCRARFGVDGNVRCEVNNGFDFRPAADASATSVFSYDAMVHFEPDVVGSYIGDLSRILRPGGRALLHHSMYSGNPGADYSENPHYRNFMTKDLFAHFAKRSKLTIIRQDVFDWGRDENLVHNIDGLTLLEKA